MKAASNHSLNHDSSTSIPSIIHWRLNPEIIILIITITSSYNFPVMLRRTRTRSTTEKLSLTEVLKLALVNLADGHAAYYAVYTIAPYVPYSYSLDAVEISRSQE